MCISKLVEWYGFGGMMVRTKEGDMSEYRCSENPPASFLSGCSIQLSTHIDPSVYLRSLCSCQTVYRSRYVFEQPKT
jgi:hypothetical protein